MVWWKGSKETEERNECIDSFARLRTLGRYTTAIIFVLNPCCPPFLARRFSPIFHPWLLPAFAFFFLLLQPLFYYGM